MQHSKNKEFAFFLALILVCGYYFSFVVGNDKFEIVAGSFTSYDFVLSKLQCRNISYNADPIIEFTLV